MSAPRRYSDTWIQVTKHKPCKICGRERYCGESDDGAAAICMFVAEGAAKRTRNDGWLHILSDVEDIRSDAPIRTLARIVRIEMRPERGDLAILARKFETGVSFSRLNRFATTLGLTCESLQRLRVGFDHELSAWSFPMTNAAGIIKGIRMRRESGDKFSVKGGHEGLFIPVGLQGNKRLLITEGPTDCAALLDLGFNAVGRPSCTGGVSLLTDLLKQLRPPEVIVVADRDEVGQRGAERLALAATMYAPSLRLITPPDGIKDAREWKRRGATARELDQIILAAAERKLSITTKVSK